MRLSRSSESSRAVALWLFATAVLVFAMVVLGGTTRLTGSGLSITEWKPVTGVIPPLSHAGWVAEFARYQRIPQYQLVNRGMSLHDFQIIYGWEWSHRLLGRLVGLVFIGPLIFFMWLRVVPRRLVWRTWVLLALGALQGVVGWWMVASGLAGRVSVAPERLMLHLGLALVLFCALIWTGLEAWAGPPEPGLTRRWPLAASALFALVFMQILLGALVAGNNAGRVYNDWPLMNGRFLPRDYLVPGGLAHSLLHSQAAVQFNHRMGAYLLTAAALAAALLAERSRRLPPQAQQLALVLGLAVLAQAALGIITLMHAAPLRLALGHQCLASGVLACALALAWRVRRA